MIKLSDKADKEPLFKYIDLELNAVNSYIKSQKEFSKEIIVFTQNFFSNVNVNTIFSTDISLFMKGASDATQKIDDNINYLNILAATLTNLRSIIKSSTMPNMSLKIDEYNSAFKDYTSKILQNNVSIERFIHSMYSLDTENFVNTNTTSDIDVISEKDSEKKKDINFKDSTLLISYSERKVVLPYKIEELIKILSENNKYKSLHEIILDLYTVPIEKYKHATRARFRECYSLILDREQGTRRQAFKLANHLCLNKSLHPAIITACKTLTELNVYLSCLNYNKLDEFPYFNIEYKSAPAISRRAK